MAAEDVIYDRLLYESTEQGKGMDNGAVRGRMKVIFGFYL